MWERLTSKGKIETVPAEFMQHYLISYFLSHLSPFFLFSPLLTLNKDPAAAAEVALFSPLPFISASVSHHLQLDRVGHKGRHTLTQGGIIRGVSDDRKSSGFTSIQRVGFFFTHTVNVSQWKQSSLYVSLWLSVWISIWAQRFVFLSSPFVFPCRVDIIVCQSIFTKKKRKNPWKMMEVTSNLAPRVYHIA